MSIIGQGNIPDDWLGEYCRYAVCWPASEQWLAVLRGVLVLPARGRFWDGHTGSIIEAQEVIRETFDTNLHLKEVIMACDDQNIANALVAIAQAIALGSGGGIGGGSGQNCGCIGATGGVQTIITLPDDSQWPVYGSGPIVPLPESGFPEGYDDLEDYNEDKCRKATKMIDDLIATLDRLGNIEWGVGVVSVIVVLGCLVGLIVVPEVVIPTLIWILVANTGITAALIAAEGYIVDNRQDWICYLLDSDSVEAVISVVSTALGVMVAFLGLPGAMGIAVTSIVLHLLNNDTLSALFSASAAHQYPEADCSGCGTCIFRWEFDTDLEDFTPRAGFIAPEWSASMGGSMALPGLGGGGSNWAGSQLTGSGISTRTGAAEEDITTDNITIRVRFAGDTDAVTCQLFISLWDVDNVPIGQEAGNVGTTTPLEVEYTFPDAPFAQIGFIEVLGGDNISTPTGTPCGVKIEWFEIEVNC